MNEYYFIHYGTAGKPTDIPEGFKEITATRAWLSVETVKSYAEACEAFPEHVVSKTTEEFA